MILFVKFLGEERPESRGLAHAAVMTRSVIPEQFGDDGFWGGTPASCALRAQDAGSEDPANWFEVWDRPFKGAVQMWFPFGELQDPRTGGGD